MENFDGGVISVIGGVVTAGLSTIAFLYKKLEVSMEKAKAEIDARLAQSEENHANCEEKYEKANQELLSMSTRLGHLEGHIDGYTKAREDIQGLSRDTLDQVHKGRPRQGEGL